MEIVIKIPNFEWLKNEEEFKTAVKEYEQGTRFDKEIRNALINGTPLPKGHGRLIDADKTLATAWRNFYAHEDEWEQKDPNYLPIGRGYDQNGFECCQQTIVNAPTIIEADKEE